LRGSFTDRDFGDEFEGEADQEDESEKAEEILKDLVAIEEGQQGNPGADEKWRVVYLRSYGVVLKFLGHDTRDLDVNDERRLNSRVRVYYIDFEILWQCSLLIVGNVGDVGDVGSSSSFSLMLCNEHKYPSEV
jgi:hypothetical protein